jgi:hypothetical protein
MLGMDQFAVLETNDVRIQDGFDRQENPRPQIGDR